MNQGWRVVNSATSIAIMTTDPLWETPEGAVAWRVRYLRTERGLTLDDLADLCTAAGFTFSRDALHRLEKGERRINLNTVFALAYVFSVSPLVLMMRPVADAAVVITDSASVSAAETYEWTVGTRPAPTSGEPTDEARAAAWLRLRKYLPYASRTSGKLRVEIDEDNIAEFLRDNN